MTSMPTLYFRTEASSAIGMGHFMRCYALAEEARSRGQKAVFLLNQVLPAMAARLDAVDAHAQCLETPIGSTHDVAAIRQIVRPGEALVVDSYKVNTAYLSALGRDFSVILFDDMAALDPMPCHAVINAAIAAFDMPYEALAPRARRLLGPDFAAIRKEFRDVVAEKGDHVAIMFGGTDVKGYSLGTAHAILDALDEAEVHVIAGPGLLDLGALRAFAAIEPRLKILVSLPSVAEALKSARIVVTAAGTSVGEIATMGLMALVVVIADNQTAHMQTCPYPVLDGRESLSEDIGQWVKLFYTDSHTSETLARTAREIYDGQGCARILDEISALTVAA